MMELDYSKRKQERDDTTTFSVEDHRFLEILEEGIKRNSDGRWVMPLPFKDKTPLHLPNNRPHCVRRLMSLKRKFKKESKLYMDYCEFINKIISKGHAKQVNHRPGRHGTSLIFQFTILRSLTRSESFQL